jgi:hypothetical protein
VTIPNWLNESTDEEELRVVLLAHPDTDIGVDAYVSDLLRLVGNYAADIKRLTETRDAEIARINMRYNARIEMAESRRSKIEAHVLDIAKTADFGKAKSRQVGNGTFGRRHTSERIEIRDKAEALKFAQMHCPDAVKTEEVQKVEHKVLAPFILAGVKRGQALPEFAEYHAGGDVPFCKVEII